MNREKIQEIIDVLKAQEAFEVQGRVIGFSMNYELSPVDANVHDVEDHFCDSVACIAGLAAVDAFGYRNAKNLEKKGSLQRVVGEEVLGLPYEKYKELFMPSIAMSWDYITREKAITVLEHLLETGMVDWSLAGLDMDLGWEGPV